MKVKQLESILGHVSNFQLPKMNLEQYTTSAHITANIVHLIGSCHDYIEDKCLVDLGTGPGILAIASSLIGFNYVLAVDIDKDALNDAQANIDLIGEDYDLGLIDLIQADVTNFDLSSKLNKKAFDVVIMNPPFGTKCNEGIDIAFLKTAFSLADDVYSLHKSSTRKFLLRKTKEWSFEAEVLYQLRYDLPSTYKCHKKNSVDIEVDFIHFSSKL